MNLWNKIKSDCAELFPNCREASRTQSEALERPLPSAKKIGLRLHLLICKWCRRYGNQIRFLREAAHEHPEELVEATPRKLSAEARERIKQRVQREK
jgi:hypothetical protein